MAPKMNKKFTLVIAGLAAATIFPGCAKEDKAPITPQTRPVAGFTFEVTNHQTRTVVFTNTSVYAQSYSWDFGDAHTSTQTSPTHSFPSYSSYIVRLTATGQGGTDIATDTVVVAP